MAEDIKFNLKVEQNNLDKALDSAAKKADGLGGVLESALGVFAGGVALKGLEVLGQALERTVRFIGDSVAAASEQEDAFNRLGQSLRAAGAFSETAIQDFSAFATELQRVSVFGDEVVIGQIAVAKSFGATNEEAKSLVQAAANLSATFGGSLEENVDKLGKTLSGSAGRLAQYIPELKLLTKEQLAAGDAAEIINRKFSGAAAAQLDTYSGKVTSLTNAYSDFQEEIGTFIIKASLVDDVLGIFKRGYEAATTALKDYRIEQERQNEGFVEGQESLGQLERKYHDLLFTITELTEASKTYGGVREAVNAKLGKSELVALEAERQALFQQIQGVRKQLAEAKKEADEQAGAEKAKKEAERQAILDQQLLTQRQQFGAELVAIDGQIETERQVQAEQFRLADLERNTVNESQFIQAELEASLLRNQAAYQAELDKNALIQDAKARNLANQISANKKILADEKATNAASIADIKNKAKLEKEIESTRLQAAQGFLAAGISLAKEGSKEQRVLQSAQALVSTYTAANQAYASPPGPPYTFPLVASVIASGLANVAKINSAKFENGGIVGQGATAGPDNRVATIRDGEMILNAGQQKQLFDAINGGGMGGPIIIQINGREIARAVRDEINNGFRLTA